MNIESPPEVMFRVRSFVSKALDVEIGDSDNLFESGLISSLFGIQLITFIERSFSLIVSDDDLVLDNFSSVENISRFVVRKRAAQ